MGQKEQFNKTPKEKTIKMSYDTWKILAQMKLDLIGSGTYEDLMKKFIESEGY